MLNVKLSVSDKTIRRLAEAQKQADVEYTDSLRQRLRDSGVYGHVTGLEELASKPLEEYEKSIQERISDLQQCIKDNLSAEVPTFI